MNPPVVGVPQTPTAAASKPRVPADAVPSQSDTPPHLVLDVRRPLITYISHVQLGHGAAGSGQELKAPQVGNGTPC